MKKWLILAAVAICFVLPTDADAHWRVGRRGFYGYRGPVRGISIGFGRARYGYGYSPYSYGGPVYGRSYVGYRAPVYRSVGYGYGYSPYGGYGGYGGYCGW